MGNNMTITSNDGRVDIVPAPEGMQAQSGDNQGYQRGSGHPDEIEDIVSIGIAMTTAEKLKEAETEVELMQILGIDEEKAREMVGLEYQELPGERLGKEDYLFDAVREVVIDMLSANTGNEDEVAIFRAFEARLADKIREKESDPINRDSKKHAIETEENAG
ncbi:hypothetical protein [Terasakiella pusilla]|uniref:hypothetical protein n=2 Tax=Terasakiella pusilla TaxID=64973 RepID=UPI003AA9CFB4